MCVTRRRAVCGSTPRARGAGTGSGLLRPRGISIVGGLLVSLVLTVYTTPGIYLYMERLRGWLAARRQVRGQVGEVTRA